MTDTDAAAAADTPLPNGAPPSAQPPAGPGGQAGPDPFHGLSEGSRRWIESKGYRSLDDAIAAGIDAQARLGAAVTLPAENAPPEEWRKFQAKLPASLRPVDSPDRVDFRRPENLPEALPYSQELADAAKPWMHEAGLSASQAGTLHDRFVAYMAAQAEAQQRATARAVEEAHDELVRDWGPPDSDGFRQKLELADRAIKRLGLGQALKAKGLLLADGSLTDPQIGRAFREIGEAMFREDTIGADGPRGGERNPFKRDAAGERDVMAISALARTDPERARRLARQAGENPDAWLGGNPY